MAPNDPNVPVMLTLAGLTYRGFYYRRLWDEVHDLAVHRAVAAGLSDRDVRAVIGNWTLVWGPATSDIEQDFDSSAMFVARSADEPARLVIAVRGTNPISLTDWIQGDLDVAHPIAWPFRDGAGGDECRVSGSTAVGLNALLRLTSPPGSYLARIAERSLSGVGEVVPESVADLVRTIHLDRTDILQPLRAKLTGLIEAWRSKAEQAASEVLGLLHQMSGARRARGLRWPVPEPEGAGQSLVDFLTRETTRAALDLIVTGHSKGGALAPALALWLAETRKRWDPKGVARIGCYTFAGPTPGNAAFGQRVIQRLDGPCLRVSNSDDLVTHAWSDAGLGSIEELYDGGFRWLGPIVTALRTQLREHDYGPANLPLKEFRGGNLQSLDHGLDPIGQVVQQHMDAYVEYAGLRAKRVDTLKLFLG